MLARSRPNLFEPTLWLQVDLASRMDAILGLKMEASSCSGEAAPQVEGMFNKTRNIMKGALREEIRCSYRNLQRSHGNSHYRS